MKRKTWYVPLLMSLGLLIVAIEAHSDEVGTVAKDTRSVQQITPDQVEAAATSQYEELLQRAKNKNALAPPTHPELVRLRAISDRLIPFGYDMNPRSKQWKWEVNLIGSKQPNVFCLPGGKIAIYIGLMDQFKPTDDELAMVLGSQMASALEEYALKQMRARALNARRLATVPEIAEMGQTAQSLLLYGTKMLDLKSQRAAVIEFDLLGMGLAARAGYDPRAAVTMLQKLSEAEKSKSSETFASHPTYQARIKAAESNMEKAMALYESSSKPSSVSQ